MALQDQNTHEKLSKLWQNDKVKTLPLQGARYVILSDIHLGDGGQADEIRLVKWDAAAVQRQMPINYGRGKLSEILEQVKI